MPMCPFLPCSYLSVSGHGTEEKWQCLSCLSAVIPEHGEESLASGLDTASLLLEDPSKKRQAYLPTLPSLCGPQVLWKWQCCPGSCSECAGWAWDGRKGQRTSSWSRRWCPSCFYLSLLHDCSLEVWAFFWEVGTGSLKIRFTHLRLCLKRKCWVPLCGEYKTVRLEGCSDGAYGIKLVRARTRKNDPVLPAV